MNRKGFSTVLALFTVLGILMVTVGIIWSFSLENFQPPTNLPESPATTTDVSQRQNVDQVAIPDVPANIASPNGPENKDTLPKPAGLLPQVAQQNNQPIRQNATTSPASPIATPAQLPSQPLVFGRAAPDPSLTVPGATNALLGRFYVKATGESMELRQISFGIMRTGAALVDAVYVKVDGVMVSNTRVSDFATTGAPMTIQLSPYPSLKAGADSTVTMEASISPDASFGDSYAINNFNIIQIKSLVTNDVFDPKTTAVNGPIVVVKMARLTTASLAQSETANVSPGAGFYLLATVELSSRAGTEDVMVTKLVFTDMLGGGTDYSGIGNFKLSSTQIMTVTSTAVKDSTVTFEFPTPVFVYRFDPVVLFLRGDILSTIGVSHKFSLTPEGIIGYGVSTGQSLTPSQVTISGISQVITVSR
jgi:hypothetical protein